MTFQLAPDITKRAKEILGRIEMPHIDGRRLAFIRSYGSKSRARARIWAFPRIWSVALGLKPHYVIEVLSEKFDKLRFDDQTKVIIHELLHIPKTFSGALKPHRTRYFHLEREVSRLYKEYCRLEQK